MEIVLDTNMEMEGEDESANSGKKKGGVYLTV